jgi:hypothetical protein
MREAPCAGARWASRAAGRSLALGGPRRRLPRCSLGVDELVDRELLDVGRPLHLHPGGGDPWLDPAFEEGIEICPRLLEGDDSPATIDRTGRVKQHPRR